MSTATKSIGVEIESTGFSAYGYDSCDAVVESVTIDTEEGFYAVWGDTPENRRAVLEAGDSGELPEWWIDANETEVYELAAWEAMN